jgi:type II secretory pathway pseudopilin PulG
MRRAVLAVGMVVLSAAGAHADLQQARAETNLEKRARLALENATVMLQAAREAYQKADSTRLSADVAEIQESVDLAYTSLNDTHKDPPKWFKYAEIQTRDLLRKLDTFQQDMSFQDRPVLDKVKEDVQQVHEKLLLGLVEGKPK